MSENHGHKIIKLGFTHNKGETFEFGIKPEDRSKHMYIIGKTGMGKSTLLEYIAIQDIQKGNGLTFMDPHGHSVEELLDYVPESRVRDCVYFNPADAEYPIALNIMEDVGYGKRHLVSSSLMSAFKKIWGEESWSDRMEHILNNTILALLEYPQTTLLDVTRMYANKAFRQAVVENIKDTQVKHFWTDEFERYTDRTAAEATPAIQNKLGQLTTNPILRNIIGQPKTSIQFKDLIDNKKLFLVNLAKGRIGETNSSILGIFLSTKLYLTTLERAEYTRKELSGLAPMNFIIDEFQSFASEAFASILSESRKYKLNLILAHQHVSQVDENIQESIFGNVGTVISFKIGPLDAEIIEKIFVHMHKSILAEDLISSSLGEYFITLSVDGESSGVFSATTKVPEPPSITSNRIRIIDRVRSTYGTKKEIAEELIRTRMDSFPKNPPKEQDKNKFKKKPDFKNNPRYQTNKPHQHPPNQNAPQKMSLKDALSKIKGAATNTQQKGGNQTQQKKDEQAIKTTPKEENQPQQKEKAQAIENTPKEAKQVKTTGKKNNNRIWSTK